MPRISTVRKDRETPAWALLIVLLLLAACSRPSEIRTSTAPSIAAQAGVTSTPFDPVLVPRATAPSLSATATLMSTPPSTGVDAIRIEFEAGAASATVTGDVSQLGVTRYVLRAFAGQTMDVAITTPRSDVLLNVIGADGTPLKRYVDGKSRWRGVLPDSQDYYLEAVSIGAATRLRLRVVLSVPAATPGPAPVRIGFAADATSATVTGHLTGYDADLYVLQASEGQAIDAVLATSPADVLLEIWGADGTVLKRHVDGEIAWWGVLPSTQDYYLKVVSFGSEADYALTVTLPASSPGTRSRHVDPNLGGSSPA
jgi:hypothetical protein